MKNRITLFASFIMLMIICGCSEVQKQFAIDDLKGQYFGKPSVVLAWSKLNIGIADQNATEVEKEIVKIIGDDNDNLQIVFEDGMTVRISNVNLANNGAIFNIPEQDIDVATEEGKVTGKIAGMSEWLFGESKCDAFYDSAKDELNFSFEGFVKVPSEGVEYDVPITVRYSGFRKIKD